MKKFFTMTLVLVMLGALLAACGSNNAGSNDGGNNGGSASSGDINVGFLAGLTGWIGAYAVENYESILLAQEEINAAGGILDGRQIKIIDIDTATTVEGAIKGFQKLVNVDKAVAAIGPETESYLALLEEAPKAGVVIMSQYAGASSLDDKNGNYAFRTAVSDTNIGETRAHVLMNNGFDEIAIMVANYEGAQSDVEYFKEKYVELGGTILEEITFNTGQNSYNGELQKIADVNPKLVYYAGGIDTAPMIFKSAHQRDYSWEWYVSPESVSKEFIEAVGADIADGIKAIMPTEDAESPNFVRFNELFTEKYDRSPSAGFFNANTYDLLITAALAMEAAGEASGKAINDYIREVSNPEGVVVNTFEEGVKELRAGNDINYEGASGPVDYDEFGNVISTNALLEVIGGVWTQTEFYPADYIQE